jgi:hypothetical protein
MDFDSLLTGTSVSLQCESDLAVHKQQAVYCPSDLRVVCRLELWRVAIVLRYTNNDVRGRIHISAGCRYDGQVVELTRILRYVPERQKSKMTSEYVEHMRLENRLELLDFENVSDEICTNQQKGSKCTKFLRNVSQTLLLADPFWLRVITMDPRILDQLNTVFG